MGRITTDQSHQLMAVLATNVDWDELDFASAGLQDSVIRNPKEAGRQFLTFLRNGARMLIPGGNVFARDMSKEGWTLLEDVSGDPLPIDQLELVSFLNEGESCIVGEEMVKRSASLKANLGQRQAEYLLENQNTIPEELRKYVLVFPGTVWQGRGGYRRVPYLYWDGRRWCLNFHWLGHDCFDRYRLLRPRE